MKSNISHIIQKFFTYLLIGIIGLMVTNKAIFMHTHQLPNGKVVLHAHPFNKNTDNQPIKSHSHSETDLKIISNLDLLFLITFLSIACVNVLTHTIVFAFKAQWYSDKILRLERDRAPPIQ